MVAWNDRRRQRNLNLEARAREMNEDAIKPYCPGHHSMQYYLLNLNDANNTDTATFDVDSSMGYYRMQRAGKISEIPKINPFVGIGATQIDPKDPDSIRVFPTYSPAYEIKGKILSAGEMFRGGCSVVLCESNGKKFLYFDSATKIEDYKGAIGKEKAIKLAAISNYRIIRDEEGENLAEDLLRIHGPREIVKDAFVSTESDRYTGLFDVQRIIKQESPFIVLEVKNPLDKSRPLELVASTDALESTENLKQILTEFYFLGTIS